MQTEAEAFLQRIRAFPDDDSPRLIFADWLEEQGSRPIAPGDRAGTPQGVEWGADRGTFIRIQIALARLMEEDSQEGEMSARTDDETLHRFQRDERDLLDRYREEWISPFHGLATGPEFRRGFVEEVNVTAREFLRHAHELFDASPLRHVHLLDVGGNLPAVLQCPYLSRLNALTIHAQHVGEPLARFVARSEHLAGLKTLRLSRNRFEDDAAEHLATSPHLALLEDLDLAENELGESGARALAASSYLGSVRLLELKHNRLGPAGAEALAASERLKALYRLGLSENEIGVARLHSVNRIHDLLRIPVLDLSSNGLGPAGLKVILTRPPGPSDPGVVRIRKLTLNHNALGDGGMRVLSECPHLEGLRVLELAWCAIGDDGCRALAESPHLNRLVSLDLSNNPVSDSGFRAFLDTPHLRSLRQLIVPRIGPSIRMRQALNARFHL